MNETHSAKNVNMLFLDSSGPLTNLVSMKRLVLSMSMVLAAVITVVVLKSLDVCPSRPIGLLAVCFSLTVSVGYFSFNPKIVDHFVGRCFRATNLIMFEARRPAKSNKITPQV